MKRKLLLLLLPAVIGLLPTTADAQIFSGRRWSEKTLITAKYSPLFYELNIGANVTDREYYADFIYFSVGYGKPTTKNEWSKYLDSPNGETPTPPSQPTDGPSGGPTGGQTGGYGQQQPTQPSQPTQPEAPAGSMDGLHAGQIALGWMHFFNHVIGFHVQAGWGFVADFGSGDDKQNQNTTRSNNDEGETKDTFIYNGIPVQAGIDINLWRQLTLQAGVTYMWEQKPVYTVGLGITF